MSKDVFPLFAAIMTAGSALVIFVILHFVVEPQKEKRAHRKERFVKFIAPLYAIVIARCKVGKELLVRKGKVDAMLMGSVKKDDQDVEFISRSTMEKFIYDNLGYSTIAITIAWSEYIVSNGLDDGRVEKAYIDQLIKSVVKEYNKTAKKLGMPYNKNELETGIPDVYAELR